MSSVPPRAKKMSLLGTPDSTSPTQEDSSTPSPPARRKPQPRQPVQAKPKNWNCRLPADLVHRIYGACEALADVEDNMHTNVAITYRALDELLEKLEDEHNGGERFYAEESPFRTGPAPSYKRRA